MIKCFSIATNHLPAVGDVALCTFFCKQRLRKFSDVRTFVTGFTGFFDKLGPDINSRARRWNRLFVDLEVAFRAFHFLVLAIDDKACAGIVTKIVNVIPCGFIMTTEALGRL